jgi:hypothetical protein
VLLTATALPVTAAPTGQSAGAYIESIYADHESPGGTARYSPRLDRLWDECYALAKKNGDACMDFSMIVMGNDALLTDVKVEQKKGGPHSDGGCKVQESRQGHHGHLRSHPRQARLDDR